MLSLFFPCLISSSFVLVSNFVSANYFSSSMGRILNENSTSGIHTHDIRMKLHCVLSMVDSDTSNMAWTKDMTNCDFFILYRKISTSKPPVFMHPHKFIQLGTYQSFYDV